MNLETSRELVVAQRCEDLRLDISGVFGIVATAIVPASVACIYPPRKQYDS